MIHILTPYRTDKNLGRAYNEAMQNIPKGDWACFMDIDCMFLTPEQPAIMQEYIKLWPNTGIFTCYTNRISQLAFEQLYKSRVQQSDSILDHIEIAQELQNNITCTTLRRGEMSGYLMLVSRETWEKVQCPEYMLKGGAIGVDTMWSRAIVRAGMALRRMDAIYVWHTYRLWKDINDKTHLYANNTANH